MTGGHTLLRVTEPPRMGDYFTASVLAMDVYNAVGVAQIRLNALRHAQMHLSSRRSLIRWPHRDLVLSGRRAYPG